MHRATYPSDAPFPRRANMVGVDLQAHHFLLTLSTQITSHRTNALSQHHGRAAVQQTKWLFSTVVYRHCGFQRVIANVHKTNIKQPNHISFTHGVERFECDFTFPDHPIISSSACNGWRTPVPSTRLT